MLLPPVLRSYPVPVHVTRYPNARDRAFEATILHGVDLWCKSSRYACDCRLFKEESLTRNNKERFDVSDLVKEDCIFEFGALRIRWNTSIRNEENPSMP